jgi:hypothetical protein
MCKYNPLCFICVPRESHTQEQVDGYLRDLARHHAEALGSIDFTILVVTETCPVLFKPFASLRSKKERSAEFLLVLEHPDLGRSQVEVMHLLKTATSGRQHVSEGLMEAINAIADGPGEDDTPEVRDFIVSTTIGRQA